MREIVTAERMRAIERAAIATGRVTGRELMERAGIGAVEAILAEWPDLARGTRRAAVLCGPGNNGGDGFVVARLLARAGWEVEVLLLGDPSRMRPDARANHDLWREIGPVADMSGEAGWRLCEGAHDLIVDAVFGTGLSRPYEIPDSVAMAFHRRMSDDFWCTGTASAPYVAALDIVSGLDADSGRLLEGAESGIGEVGAHLTIAFGQAKPGHFLGEGPARTGALRIADIGTGALVDPARQPSIRLAGPPWGPLALPTGTYLSKARRAPGEAEHKFSHGHALVLSGGMGRSSAARLAARAALRVGAGVVTLAAPGSAMLECAAQLTAVMLARCDDAEALGAILRDGRIGALCLGPGLGTGEREAAIVAAALASGRAAVLDADAITLLARSAELRAALHGACVLTPHDGEFARLCPDLAERMSGPARSGPAFSRLDAAREAAARLGATVLLKGPATVIASPSGACVISDAVRGRAVPWLATAGAGDVLSGLVAGLLARSAEPASRVMEPWEAAEAGAWLHVECARALGPGMIAEDLPDALPQVLGVLAGG